MAEAKTRRWVSSGTHWEEFAAYARAVRAGDMIFVSGTTAHGPNGLVGAGDPAAQARFIYEKIEKAMKELGSSLRDVVKTRVYVADIRNWEAVAKVHGEVFRSVRPANVLVEARLVGPEYLVEIEVDAVVGSGDAIQPKA